MQNSHKHVPFEKQNSVVFSSNPNNAAGCWQSKPVDVRLAFWGITVDCFAGLCAKIKNENTRADITINYK